MTTTKLTPVEAAVAKLARSPQPLTAAELGVSAKALQAAPGVEVVGTRRTGKRGRPALLFQVA